MPKPKKRRPPVIGTTFTKRYKGHLYTMRVVKRNAGVGYSVDRVTYKTPSAAANSISKGKANGWTFWKID
jgi:hypothetical protein